MTHAPPPLRLTKSYTRVGQTGRPQQVRQYPTPHPGHLSPSAAVDGKMPKVQAAWNSVKAGQVVDFGGEPWKIVADAIQTKAGVPNNEGLNSTGKGIRTGAPKNTYSKGRGMNTVGGVKNNNTKGAKPGASDSMITHVLENMWTGKRVQIKLNSAFKVWVY